MGKRQRYVVEYGSDDHDVGSVCEAVFDVLDASVKTLRVDAYSDYTDQMPDDIRRAQEWLRSRGLARGDGDPGMGIVIERSDEIGWAITRAYAPWSIRTTLVDARGVNVASLEDGGHSVTVHLAGADAAALGNVIGPDHVLVLLSDDNPKPGRTRESGLDPDISVAYARLQAPRVARARGLQAQ